MIDTVFIGIGSPIGFDQVGWVLLDQLQSRCNDTTKFQFIRCSHPSEWIEEIPSCRRAVFIDACISEAPAGSVCTYSLQEIAHPNHRFPGSSHGFGLLSSIEMGIALDRLPEKIEIITISITAADPSRANELPQGFISIADFERTVKNYFC